MSMLENRLVVACNQVGQVVDECMDWVSANGRELGAERISLLHELHASEAAAELLAQSATQPASVAFVGGRRSGKTSTIIAMINGGGSRLGLRFDGIKEAADFSNQISPDGKAGLSMAVRFSDKKKKSQSKNFPISLRLLPLSGVVKILGSAFMADSASRDRIPTLDDLRAVHLAAAKAAGTVRFPGFTEEDAWEIRRYFAERFESSAAFKILSAADYWQTLAKFGPRLNAQDRGSILAPLWGNLAAVTGVFVTLARIADSLGGPLEAKCALSALVSSDPRTGKLVRSSASVIDGATALKLGCDDDDTVLVSNEHGLWTSVPLSGLAALATEVHLTLTSIEGGFLNETDVLEFPSIETSRRPVSFIRALDKDPAVLGQAFLHAKAIYLLDRAIEEHKITSMVVCADPAARDTGDLARLVQKWVEKTQGANATAREHQDKSLFLALTKADKWIAPANQNSLDWDIGLKSILIDGFGGHHGWPEAWTEGQPFDGVHLVRSTNIKLKHLFDYGGDGSETGIKLAHKDRIEQAGRDFANSALVRRHVCDPEAAWHEVIGLNDGGISLLAQSIAEVCHGRVKRRQINLALDELRRSIKQRLQRYFLSDSLAFQRDKRHAGGLYVLRRLRNCIAHRRLGPLLRSLQIPASELIDVFNDLNLKDAALASSRNAAAGADAGNGHATAMIFAQAAIEHWVKSVRALSGNATAGQTYELPGKALIDLVDELIVGSARTGLDERMARKIASIIVYSSDKQETVGKAAICAARLLSDFVTNLGYDNVMSNTQPRRKGRDRQPIFAPLHPIQATDTATAASVASAAIRDFHADWGQAFLRLVDDNVSELRNRDTASDQNHKLGRLLKQLDASSA